MFAIRDSRLDNLKDPVMGREQPFFVAESWNVPAVLTLQGREIGKGNREGHNTYISERSACPLNTKHEVSIVEDL